MMPDQSKILSDVLDEFAFAMKKPVTTILDYLILNYPQHADVLDVLRARASHLHDVALELEKDE